MGQASWGVADGSMQKDNPFSGQSEACCPTPDRQQTREATRYYNKKGGTYGLNNTFFP